MGVNFSSYEIGRRAIRAGQFGLQVAGQNIANVNTPGYTRQGVQLSTTPPASATINLTGGGVTIDGVRSFRDKFVESRLQTETSISGRLTAQRDALSPVDSILSDPSTGGGIQQAISGFFNAFADLEAHPTSVPLREATISRATALGTAFGLHTTLWIAGLGTLAGNAFLYFSPLRTLRTIPPEVARTSGPSQSPDQGVRPRGGAADA